MIKDYRILKALERRGFIKTRDGVERHWSGHRVRNYFVSAGDKLDVWYRPFNYNGKEYRIQYFDGCFHPFVVEIGKSLPTFI